MTGGNRVKSKFLSFRVLAAQRRKGFEISKASRLCYRTRYFTDSGIIGSKQFVATNYKRFNRNYSVQTRELLED